MRGVTPGHSALGCKVPNPIVAWIQIKLNQQVSWCSRFEQGMRTETENNKQVCMCITIPVFKERANRSLVRTCECIETDNFMSSTAQGLIDTRRKFCIKRLFVPRPLPLCPKSPTNKKKKKKKMKACNNYKQQQKGRVDVQLQRRPTSWQSLSLPLSLSLSHTH